MIQIPTDGLLFKGTMSKGRLHCNGPIQNLNVFRNSGVLEVVANAIAADIPVLPGPNHEGGASSSAAASVPKMAKMAKKAKKAKKGKGNGKGKKGKPSNTCIHPHYTLDILGNNGTVYSFRASVPLTKGRATAYVYRQGTREPGLLDGDRIAVYMVENRPLLFKDGEVITPVAVEAVAVQAVAVDNVGEAAVGNILKVASPNVANIAARASGSKRKAETLEVDDELILGEMHSDLLHHFFSSFAGTKRARKLSPKVIEERETQLYVKLQKVSAPNRKTALFSAIDADVASSSCIATFSCFP